MHNSLQIQTQLLLKGPFPDALAFNASRAFCSSFCFCLKATSSYGDTYNLKSFYASVLCSSSFQATADIYLRIFLPFSQITKINISSDFHLSDSQLTPEDIALGCVTMIWFCYQQVKEYIFITSSNFQWALIQVTKAELNDKVDHKKYKGLAKWSIHQSLCIKLSVKTALL